MIYDMENQEQFKDTDLTEKSLEACLVKIREERLKRGVSGPRPIVNVLKDYITALDKANS